MGWCGETEAREQTQLCPREVMPPPHLPAHHRDPQIGRQSPCPCPHRPLSQAAIPRTKWLPPGLLASPPPQNFLLSASPPSCPLFQLFLAVRGYIYPLCSCSSSVTIFCYRIFWLLVEALIRNAAINGCAPLPLGCSFFNPHCLLQCHPFPFFFIEFQVYCTC